MAEEASFRNLIQKVRQGDQQAATDLVRRYEPVLRRTIRVRLGDPHMERILDSMDICQSVLASFFVRMNLGQFEIENPQQLLKLLGSLARNKVSDQARQMRALRRGGQLQLAEGVRLDDLPAPDPTPSRALMGRELLEQARARLTAEEWCLVEQRLQGRGWAELAAESGRTPEALRKQLERAVERVAAELGLDE